MELHMYIGRQLCWASTSSLVAAPRRKRACGHADAVESRQARHHANDNAAADINVPHRQAREEQQRTGATGGFIVK